MIRIANSSDNCINQYKKNDNNSSKHHCVMCNNNIDIDDFVILSCGCCFHYSCILKEFYVISKRKNLLYSDGILCTNYSCLNNFRHITPYDIDIIIDLFRDKLLEEKRLNKPLTKYYIGFYEDYEKISTNLRNLLNIKN